MPRSIYEESLKYHSKKPYGKISIASTKPLVGQYDLSLAYSPGVAEPCEIIKNDPKQASYLTAKSNLIAVITNGTAVLGLGNIGPLAAKPVMEGKAVLFKKFAGIDAFDIEIDETDPDKLIDIIASLEPTFGGINLEDIKSPECFYIEEELKKRLKIPVLHDDQHGTAIVTAAALHNALYLQKKDIKNIKLVCNGAGAAAMACINLLYIMGVKKENILMLDREGVLTHDRLPTLTDIKKNYAQKTACKTLKDAMCSADVFLGLSSANVVTKDMILSMNDKPIVFALSNPEPEISPALVMEARSDAIIATGRSDFPNQVNNAVCYPYIFRGALDVSATIINDEMKIACVHAISRLARITISDVVTNAYGGEFCQFGPSYIIPKPFDKRLHVDVSLAVAKAAMETGVATRPIENFSDYKQELEEFVYRSSHIMRPIFNTIHKVEKDGKKRIEKIVFSEGEEDRVLQAAQHLCDEQICHPILIGRPEVIKKRISDLTLSLEEDVHFTLINPNKDDRFFDYWTHYHDIMGRHGVSPTLAKNVMRTNNTAIASMMVKRGDANGMVCGTVGQYLDHFKQVKNIIGLQSGVNQCYTVCLLVMDKEVLFLSDPYLTQNPNFENLIEMTELSIDVIHQFGIEPKVALVSRSNFGMMQDIESLKMADATAYLQRKFKDLQIDGEMQADVALQPILRNHYLKKPRLKDAANLLIMPNIDAAHIAYSMTKALHNGLTIGPILMGLDDAVHIANQSISVRGIINLASFAAMDIKHKRKSKKN